MANKKHLAILQQGVEAWNAWRKQNPKDIPDLSGANLRRATLGKADLRGADLSKAKLTGAYLYEAILAGAYLYEAKLNRANLFKAVLFKANLHGATLNRAILSRADIGEANLSTADLTGAILTAANLSDANLTVANLSKAKLSGANLCATKALGTNFRGAILTGACIADWNANDAILDDVFCKYVYRKFDCSKNQKTERCPYGRNYEPGEFKKVFQKVQDTIELIFSNGVDWAAFAYSFQVLQVKYEDQPLEIKSIDNRDGVIVVEVKVPLGTDKEKAKGSFYEGYNLACKVLEEQYQAQIKDKDEKILDYKKDIAWYKQQISQEKSQINGLIALAFQQELVQKELVNNPRNTFNYDLRGSGFAGGFSGTTHGNQIGGNIYNNGQQQDFNPESSQ